MLVQSLDEVLISQVPESAKIRKRRRIVTSDSEGECRESGPATCHPRIADPPLVDGTESSGVEKRPPRLTRGRHPKPADLDSTDDGCSDSSSGEDDGSDGEDEYEEDESGDEDGNEDSLYVAQEVERVIGHMRPFDTALGAFKIYVQKLFIDLARTHPPDPYFARAYYFINDTVQTRRENTASDKWRPPFKAALDTYPELDTCEMLYSRPGCEACTFGTNRIATMSLSFSGQPYDNRTFLAAAATDTDTTFEAGRDCTERGELYHQLAHYNHRLLADCRRKVNETSRGMPVESADVVSRLIQSDYWIEQLYGRYDALLREADQYLTRKPRSAESHFG